jgi:hypothetical protein
MNEMIAFCGLDCHQCGALIATRENDDVKRKEVADLWAREFGAEFQVQEINCEGCISEGEIHFRHCYECEIRKCGMAKGVENCAYCTEYACEKLGEFLTMVPEARTRLDNIKAEL